MLVNKENVARVIEYTENLTRSWVSQGNTLKGFLIAFHVVGMEII